VDRYLTCAVLSGRFFSSKRRVLSFVSRVIFLGTLFPFYAFACLGLAAILEFKNRRDQSAATRCRLVVLNDFSSIVSRPEYGFWRCACDQKSNFSGPKGPGFLN